MVEMVLAVGSLGRLFDAMVEKHGLLGVLGYGVLVVLPAYLIFSSLNRNSEIPEEPDDGFQKADGVSKADGVTNVGILTPQPSAEVSLKPLLDMIKKSTKVHLSSYKGYQVFSDGRFIEIADELPEEIKKLKGVCSEEMSSEKIKEIVSCDIEQTGEPIVSKREYLPMPSSEELREAIVIRLKSASGWDSELDRLIRDYAFSLQGMGRTGETIISELTDLGISKRGAKASLKKARALRSQAKSIVEQHYILSTKSNIKISVNSFCYDYLMARYPTAIPYGKSETELVVIKADGVIRGAICPIF